MPTAGCAACPNRGAAVFDGDAVPLVGRVSMDLTTFDVTDHPGIEARRLAGADRPGRSLDEVAEAAGTNGYEVLTSLGAAPRPQGLSRR